MPAVRILDNVQLEANSYVVRVKEIEAGIGPDLPGQFMAMDPMGGQVQLPGHHVLEPTFGLPATWIDDAPAGRGANARLHGGRCRDRDLDASDRGHQGATCPSCSRMSRCRSS